MSESGKPRVQRNVRMTEEIATWLYSAAIAEGKQPHVLLEEALTEYLTERERQRGRRYPRKREPKVRVGRPRKTPPEPQD